MSASWMARARSSLMPCCPWCFQAPLVFTIFPCLVECLPDFTEALAGFCDFLVRAKAGAAASNAKESRTITSFVVRRGLRNETPLQVRSEVLGLILAPLMAKG